MIKRLLTVSAALFVATACGGDDPSSPELDRIPTAAFAMSDNAAIVIKNDGSCGMPGADANGDIIFGGVGVQTTKVENGNKVMLKCVGEDITNLSGRAQSFRGFGCGVPFPSGGGSSTTDTHATVSASGVGTLTCTVTLP
jgi:hypothetical protein